MQVEQNPCLNSKHSKQSVLLSSSHANIARLKKGANNTNVACVTGDFLKRDMYRKCGSSLGMYPLCHLSSQQS